VSADLGDRQALDRAATEAAAFGPPDILVNCAGLNLRPPMAGLTIEQWDQLVAVNLTAPFLLGQRFGPLMAARGWGRIINVTSQQADRAFGNMGGQRRLLQRDLPWLRRDPADGRGLRGPGQAGCAGGPDDGGTQRDARRFRRRGSVPRRRGQRLRDRADHPGGRRLLGDVSPA
jgi:NAD(P)-dependent dehydrogenase (short-subunit alcohol dehydrogenase family)